MRSRNIFIIIGIISGLIVLAVVLFLLSLNVNPQAPGENQAVSDNQSAPPQLTLSGPASGGWSEQNLSPYQATDSPYRVPQLVFDQPILDASLGADGQQIYLLTTADRELGSFNLAKENFNAISSLATGCAILQWSPGGRYVAVLDSETPQIINLATGQVIPLNGNIRNLIFSPAGDKIAYQYYTPETKQSELTVANVDGQNFEKITHLNDLTSAWSDTVILHTWSPDGYLYVSAESSDLSATPLQRVRLSDHDRQALVGWTDVRALQYSPKGNLLAGEILGPGDASQTTEYLPRIALIDPSSGRQTDLGMSTFLNKCAWSHDEKSLFCALSADLYSSQSQDVIVKIDVATKQQTQITGIVADQNFNVRHPFLSHDDRQLYFINGPDDKLYAIDL